MTYPPSRHCLYNNCTAEVAYQLKIMRRSEPLLTTEGLYWFCYPHAYIAVGEYMDDLTNDPDVFGINIHLP